jgi:hypothetical protein
MSSRKIATRCGLNRKLIRGGYSVRHRAPMLCMTDPLLLDVVAIENIEIV